VGSAALRHPVLERFYRRYLEDASSAAFVWGVSQHYTIGTLERLAERGRRETRRAATLALGYVADFRSNAVLGRRMRDADRGVRLLAENGIRELWLRDGSDSQQLRVRAIARLNVAGQYQAVVQQASQLLEEAPEFAEVWYQRADAQARLERYAESIRDGKRALELNPYHFAAAVETGLCHLQLGETHATLACFQRALSLNPGLERVRVHVARLKRKLKRRPER
jgi:tetratricopeptide (TPR) repeat protein